MAYYHGSNVPLNIITPKFHRLIATPVIFATNHKWAAIFFSSKLRDNTIGMGFINGTPFLVESAPNAFDTFKGCPGYVHHLNPENFHDDLNLGMPGVEFISTTNETVVFREFIPDIYNALQHSVQMVSYENRHEFMF